MCRLWRECSKYAGAKCDKEYEEGRIDPKCFEQEKKETG